MTKPIPKVYATRFFQLITTRQFAEAERILERVKQKMHISERNRGYFQALYGMLLTQRSNDDRYAFLSGMDLTDKKQLKNFRQEFLTHVESRLHAEYDRGFFEAWVDYMKILPKLEASVPSVKSKGVADTDEKKGSELVVDVEAKEEKAELERVEDSAKENPELELAKPGQSTLVDFAK